METPLTIEKKFTQNASLVLKKADLKDIENVHILLTFCGQHMFNHLGLNHWHPFAPLEKFKDKVKHATLYCIYENDRMIATFNLSTTPRPYYTLSDWKDPNAKAVYLGHLAIHPDFQGKKIGTWCIHQIEQIAKEMGAQSIRFDCIERHPWLSSFYEKMGYARKNSILMPDPTGTLVCFEKVI